MWDCFCTLVYWIEVQARLLILKRESHLHGLILVCAFINFEEIFSLHINMVKKQLQYLFKTTISKANKTYSLEMGKWADANLP